jgi:hypothetical protein
MILLIIINVLTSACFQLLKHLNVTYLLSNFLDRCHLTCKDWEYDEDKLSETLKEPFQASVQSLMFGYEFF